MVPLILIGLVLVYAGVGIGRGRGKVIRRLLGTDRQTGWALLVAGVVAIAVGIVTSV